MTISQPPVAQPAPLSPVPPPPVPPPPGSPPPGSPEGSQPPVPPLSVARPPRSKLRRRASFRTRLSVLAALAVGFAVAAGALASYIAVHHELVSQVDSSLNDQVGEVLHQALGGYYVFDPRAVSSGNAVEIVDASGTVLLSSLPPSGKTVPISGAIKSLASETTQGNSRLSTAAIGGADYRVLTVSLGSVQLNMEDGSRLVVPSAALVVAHPLADIDRTLADLRLILFLVGLSGVAVALALGYGAALAMIRPVERLTAAAEHVAATQDLAARIDEEGDDELARLGHSFNAMLGALQASRQQQAQLVADAGHELRTPLTSLRTNIELLMRAPDLDSTDRDELLSDVRAQLEELTTLVGDLVDMARDDEQLAEPVDVRFDQIVERAVERARRRAMSLTFEVHLDVGEVRTQPALLERAVLNVLDNAAKWSPPAGSIEVTLTRGATWLLEVRDHGPGVAPEDLPKVFDRFYRAQSARSLPGSGLGLAIVRKAVEADGGSVAMHLPPDGGTLVTIELPVAPRPATWPPPPPPPRPGGGAWPAGQDPAPAAPPVDPVPSSSDR